MQLKTIEDIQDLVNTWNEQGLAVLNIARLLYKLEGDEQFVYDWGIYQSKDEKEPHIWLQYMFDGGPDSSENTEMPLGEEIRFPARYLLMTYSDILQEKGKHV